MASPSDSPRSKALRLVLYPRVSSVGQIDGYGIPSQRRDMKTWARREGHRTIDIGDEVFTGTVAERPVLAEAFTLVEDCRADGLLIPRLDRIARELTVQEAVLAKVWQLGGRVFAANEGEILQDDPDDPMRTAMRQMQGVFAQLDRGMITKRLRDGMRTKREQGRHAVGCYPYGYTAHRHGRQVDKGPEMTEQRTVARILELRNVNAASYRAIARMLDEEGLRPRYADKWSAMAVRVVYLREMGMSDRGGKVTG